MLELTKMGVYIKHTQLEMIKSRAIATLFKSHSFFIQYEDAIKYIKEQIIEATRSVGPPSIFTPGYHTHLPPLSHTGKSKTINKT